jgi:hypothetical protein
MKFQVGDIIEDEKELGTTWAIVKIDKSKQLYYAIWSATDQISVYAKYQMENDSKVVDKLTPLELALL